MKLNYYTRKLRIILKGLVISTEAFYISECTYIFKFNSHRSPSVNDAEFYELKELIIPLG